MIEPTSEQEARIDALADTYDSVSVRMTGPWPAPLADITCWRRRESGAMYAVDGMVLTANGRRLGGEVPA